MKKYIVILLMVGILIFLFIKFKNRIMNTFREHPFFDKVIDVIIERNEGGAKIVNDPNDKGGVTKYGIAKNYNRDIDVENLTKDEAKQIYYNRYFKPLPKINDLNFFYQVLDHSINAGVSSALKLYRNNKDLESFKKARLLYYSKLKQFPIYKNSWLRRVNYAIV